MDIRRVLRAIAIAGGGVAMLALTVSATGAGVFRTSNPARALKFAPYDAVARSSLARAEVMKALGAEQAVPPALRAQAERAARAAIRRDATAVPAVETLGLIASAQGDKAAAKRLFLQAERLSRRALSTQLWLVEQSVGDNDVKGALRHYDLAMRTSEAVRGNLVEVLVSAAADPQISRELARLLSTRPNWRLDFLTRMVALSESPAALRDVVLPSLNLRDPDDRKLGSMALLRMVSLGEPATAWSAFAAAVSGRAAASVRDPMFCSADGEGLAPFDWQFNETPAAAPSACERVPGFENTVLLMPTAPEREEEAARQMIHLSPGRYRIAAKVGAGAAEPSLALRCANGNEASLLTLPSPPASVAAQPVAGDFIVPEGCAFQWLSIRVRPGNSPGVESSSWISDIAISARP